MLKKGIRLFAIFCLLFESLTPSVYAQMLEVSPARNLPEALDILPFIASQQATAKMIPMSISQEDVSSALNTKPKTDVPKQTSKEKAPDVKIIPLNAGDFTDLQAQTVVTSPVASKIALSKSSVPISETAVIQNNPSLAQEVSVPKEALSVSPDVAKATLVESKPIIPIKQEVSALVPVASSQPGNIQADKAISQAQATAPVKIASESADEPMVAGEALVGSETSSLVRPEGKAESGPKILAPSVIAKPEESEKGEIKAPAPLNTHLVKSDKTTAPILGAGDSQNEPESFAGSSLGSPKGRKDFKLFEPARYAFMQDSQLMLPPDQADDESDNYYKYSRTYLENVIKGMEGGIEIKERSIEYMEILNPSLLLPIYGTTISLTGRKTFGLKYDVRKYKVESTVSDKSYSNMDIEQELQMKVQGKISDRIFVDIDYDDQREEAQNIAVSYRGKGDELVQSADFGDIELSLPGTEFISYNKQVFGAKMHLKYGGANLRVIGSQSKGESKNKQFKGDSVFETMNVRDIQYIRRRYYDLTFDHYQNAGQNWGLAIVPNSETVYLDDHTNQGYQEALQVQDLKVPTSVYPIDGAKAAFKVLTRGVDYIVDYNRNILIFNSPLRDTDVVAINYQNTAGDWLSNAVGTTPGDPKIVKTSNDRPIVTQDELGWQLEIKRYYNIGATQITRDNGQGNFILKLLESDGKESCPATNAPDYCRFTVDYEKGIFEIGGRFADAGIYNPTPASAKNRYFFIQYTSTVKTYFLEPDVVVQSETVTVNGATMARNKDYYVDYASGFITFYNENLIGSNSVIDVSYEVSTGGSSSESSLLGGRFNYDFTDKISIGASILNQGNSAPKRVPQVGNLAQNLTTMEADFKAKDVEVLDGVKLSLGAEAAESRLNENLFGYAMVDNMEETKEYVKASTIFRDWKIASNPTYNGQMPPTNANFFDAIKWDSEEVPLLQINPAAAANRDDKQNVLLINYDFDLAASRGYPDRDEVSIVFPISNYGVDFTDKTLLELSMQGEANGPQINISFGTMDERSDNYSPNVPPPAGFVADQVFPTCSKYYTPGFPSVPKTEDLRCTGLLTPSEDVGWIYLNPDNSYQRYNPFANNKYNKEPQPNGVIDTQDLNGNNILDYEDLTAGGSFGFAGSPLFPAYLELANNTINYTGWKQFQQEVNFNDGTQRWTSIRQMRITLKKAPGGKTKGAIRVANLSVSGSTWQPLDNDEKELLTYGINNIDNPNYKPIFNDNGDGGEVFRELYGSVNEMRSNDGTNNIKEQSLALQYDFSKTALRDVNVQRNFSAMDFSQHREFRFLLYNNGPNDGTVQFYLRIQTDDDNYSEIEVPLDFQNAWHLYSLKMIDTNDDGTPERWESNSKYPATTDNAGYLNYKRIGSIKVGIRSDNGINKGEVWLDDIFLADAVMSVGRAYMAEGKIEVENWFEAGGKVKYMDDKFQTPVAVPTKQTNTQQDYYLKFKRIENLPISATYYKSDTDTPDVLGYDKSNTVSLLDQGQVTRDKGTIKAEYIKPNIPKIGVEYTFENADYEKLQRSDDKRTYAANVDYSPSSQNPVVKNITAGTSLVKSKIGYSDDMSVSSASTYYDTNETTKNYNFKLSLAPWQGASIVPSYNLSTANERRRYYDSSPSIQSFREKSYSKYASQNVGVSSSIRINRWLAPTASYSVSIRENNNLTPLSYSANNVVYNFDVGTVKSVNRTSDGNVGVALNGKEIFPNSKLLAGFTLSGTYKLQDGDSWENVDDDVNALDKIWVRNSLGIDSPYSYRSQLTLRDTYTATVRWNPFREYSLGGRSAPLKTLSIMNNFSRGYQTNENLGSMYETKTSTLPDVVVFMDDLQKFVTDSTNILSGTSLKFKYNISESDVVGSEFRRDSSYGGDFRFLLMNYFDTTLTYTQQTLNKTDTKVNAPLENYLRRDLSAQTAFEIKRVKFTPKVTYIYDTRTQVGDVLVNDVEEVVPSLNIKADFNMPFGIKLPFISRQYLVTNRVIWNTNVSYSRRRSYTVTENRDLFDINTNFDYELSKNIRITLSGAFQQFKHLYIKEESYTAYNIGTVFTIQF